jgi:hypothetical protein
MLADHSKGDYLACKDTYRNSFLNSPALCQPAAALQAAALRCHATHNPNII